MEREGEEAAAGSVGENGVSRAFPCRTLAESNVATYGDLGPT